MTGQLEAGGARRFIHRWQSASGGGYTPAPPLPWEDGYTGHLGTWQELRGVLNIGGLEDDVLYTQGFRIGDTVHYLPPEAVGTADYLKYSWSYLAPFPVGDLIATVGTADIYSIATNEKPMPSYSDIYTYPYHDSISLSICRKSGTKIVSKYSTPIGAEDGTKWTAKAAVAPLLLPVYDILLVQRPYVKGQTWTAADIFEYVKGVYGEYATRVWLPDGITGDDFSACAVDDLLGKDLQYWDTYSETPPGAFIEDVDGVKCCYPTSAARDYVYRKNFFGALKGLLGVCDGGIALPKSTDVTTLPTVRGFVYPSAPMCACLKGKTETPYGGAYYDVAICYIVKQLYPTKITRLGEAYYA